MPGAEDGDFLRAVRAQRKRLALVTNAHGKALALKLRHTRIGDHFDAIWQAR